MQVDLCYAKPGGPPTWRRVHPHGLVVKNSVWYLVASAPAGLRTYKVSRIEADGRRHIRLSVPGAAHAAAELVSFADSLDVASPPEVRQQLAAIGQRLVDRYATTPVPL